MQRRRQEKTKRVNSYNCRHERASQSTVFASKDSKHSQEFTWPPRSASRPHGRKTHILAGCCRLWVHRHICSRCTCKSDYRSWPRQGMAMPCSKAFAVIETECCGARLVLWQTWSWYLRRRFVRCWRQRPMGMARIRGSRGQSGCGCSCRRWPSRGGSRSRGVDHSWCKIRRGQNQRVQSCSRSSTTKLPSWCGRVVDRRDRKIEWLAV